jgi:hypothetical protein
MRSFACIALCIAFASCSMYNSNFDCPPGKGIGCKPVNEVLYMIVENDDGEDLFVTDPEEAHLLKTQAKKKRKKPTPSIEERKKLYLLKERSGDPVLIQETVEREGAK